MELSAKQVAKDLAAYAAPVIAVLSVLANVPGASHVFHATGAIQGVLDAVVVVATAVLSVAKQVDKSAAVASAVKAVRAKKAAK
ncbi:MAG TPA: hypothetical protein VF288_10540 [Mycobacteriales bacterium]